MKRGSEKRDAPPQRDVARGVSVTFRTLATLAHYCTRHTSEFPTSRTRPVPKEGVDGSMLRPRRAIDLRRDADSGEDGQKQGV